MRKAFLLICWMLAALLAVSVAAAQEEDGSLALPVLEDGVEVEGEFEDSSMQIYFFIGSEGDEVSIVMEQEEGSSLDPFVVLLGPAGQVIAYNDDSGNSDLEIFASEIVDAELPVTGAYLVVASSFSEYREPSVTPDTPLDEPLAYTLTVSGFSAPEDMSDEDDDLSGIIVEAADGGVDASGTVTLTAELPVAYLFFPAEEGQEISLTTSEASDSETPLSDPLIYIFDAEGNRIAGSDDADGLFAATSVEAPDSGIYVAFVTSYRFWTAGEDPDAYTGVGDVNVELRVE
jgi:hypothetical protein